MDDDQKLKKVDDLIDEQGVPSSQVSREDKEMLADDMDIE